MILKYSERPHSKNVMADFVTKFDFFYKVPNFVTNRIRIRHISVQLEIHKLVFQDFDPKQADVSLVVPIYVLYGSDL